MLICIYNRDGQYWNFDIMIIVEQNSYYDYHDYSVFVFKTVYKRINMYLFVPNLCVNLTMTKRSGMMIFYNYCFPQLLFVIISTRYWLLIITKENIMVNS